jgi:7-cyano-7-deazaguanine synthase in queuosine biosynthesis
MFSGGLDSTGVFWKLMQEKNQIHVHHMNLINRENRDKAERVAVRDICDYMKKIGKFEYSESTHECPTVNSSFMWDSDLYNFMAGALCLSNLKIKSVALGLTKTDLDGSGGEQIKKRIERGTNIFKSFQTGAEKTYPIINMSKKEIYEMMPVDLRDLTWSCRTPIYEENRIIKCGRCKACKEIKHIISPK